jgi:hypothetical protein
MRSASSLKELVPGLRTHQKERAQAHPLTCPAERGVGRYMPPIGQGCKGFGENWRVRTGAWAVLSAREQRVCGLD